MLQTSLNLSLIIFLINDINLDHLDNTVYIYLILWDRIKIYFSAQIFQLWLYETSSILLLCLWHVPMLSFFSIFYLVWFGLFFGTLKYSRILDIFPASQLESAISPRRLGYFHWIIVLRNHSDTVVSGVSLFLDPFRVRIQRQAQQLNCMHIPLIFFNLSSICLSICLSLTLIHTVSNFNPVQGFLFNLLLLLIYPIHLP